MIAGNKVYHAREMMLGLKTPFDYLECAACGCIQLMNIPQDMEKYYPEEDYYSFHSDDNINESKNSLSTRFRRIQSDYLVFGKHKLLGSLLCMGYVIPGYYSWLRKVNANFQTSVLDLGSGCGELLFRLRRIGFENLTGADPFIKEEIDAHGVKIYKKDVFSLEGKYEFIMINHAFEHMDEPLQVLKKIYDLLTPGGCLMIRIPVSDAYCWKQYGIDWAPLDAPRHLYIHSAKSMQLLADKSDFRIDEIIHDATAFQFWGSEQYKNDIALIASNSYSKNKSISIFTKKQINDYKRRIKELNKQKMGGDAAFFLYKK